MMTATKILRIKFIVNNAEKRRYYRLYKTHYNIDDLKAYYYFLGRATAIIECLQQIKGEYNGRNR